jgi:hypothetical protein
MVVLRPRYIKIIYVPQQATITQVLKFGVTLKQQCLLKWLAAFSHMLSLTMKINTMSFPTYRIFYLSYDVYNGRIR